MSRNKTKANSNKPLNATQPANTSQSSVAAAFQKANMSVKTVESLLIENGVDVPQRSLDKSQLDYIADNETDKKLMFEEVLSDITSTAKKLLELHEDLQKRSSELARLEEPVARKSDENKKRADELKRFDDELKQRQIELKKTESKLTDLERDLELRELDARAGFATQNIAALAQLKNEIFELESRKSELQLGVQQAELKARVDEDLRLAKLIELQSETASKERLVEKSQIRLDREWKELEREKLQIRDEVRKESIQDLAMHVEARQRAEMRIEKIYKDWSLTEQKLEQYQEITDALMGRSPVELLDELANYKQKVKHLENDAASNQGDQLHAENESLRKIRDSQKLQIDDLHRELASTKGRLHKLSLGVSDVESLTKEKFTLEKHGLILSARLNDLGATVDKLTNAQQSDKPFPQLAWMDSATNADWIKERKAAELMRPEQDVPELKSFSIELQHRIAQAENTPLFFQLEDIQLLIAGLAMSRLHIFQGISGTGKTSLAKAFAKAMGGHCTDIAVQAGWRDKDDLIGHYNAFEKRFYERDCLQGLYRAQTDAYKNRCNIILLDEMNLSRPEQYFADFLSALEKNDHKERLITLSEGQLPYAPGLLVEGRKIIVPNNVWFVGTANHDETTSEFADKTYDRAHIMTLPRHETRFNIDHKDKASFSYISLVKRFDAAISHYKSEVEEMLTEITTGPLTKLLEDRFDLGWGNRFERQALQFVPVYMAAGGRKQDAMDHLLASRIFRNGKVTGRHDIEIEDLKQIEIVLKKTWQSWGSDPNRSIKEIAKDIIRKER